jgi:hypothetical protein
LSTKGSAPAWYDCGRGRGVYVWLFGLLPKMAEYRFDGSPKILRRFGECEDEVRVVPDECAVELLTRFILLVVR